MPHIDGRILLALILIVQTMLGSHQGTGTCQCLSLDDLELKLHHYIDDDEFNRSIAAYYDLLERAEIEFPDATDNNRYIHQYIAVCQMEISARNYAIKRFMADSLRELFADSYSKPVDYFINEPLRDVTLKLQLSRAKLRAKITMLQGNEYQWSNLYELVVRFAPTESEARSVLMAKIRAGMPKEALNVVDELSEQADYTIVYWDLREAAYALTNPNKKFYFDSGHVFKILDQSLDRYTGCGELCGQLIMRGWTDACPLGPNFKVDKWLDNYVEPKLIESMLATRRQVADHLHLANIYELVLNKREVIDQYLKELLTGRSS